MTPSGARSLRRSRSRRRGVRIRGTSRIRRSRPTSRRSRTAGRPASTSSERSPVNGYVTNLTLVLGQYAAVGTKLMALIDSDSYRVEGYFEETKMPVIKPGARVEIHLMSGEPALHGHVETISHGITDRDNANGPELLANVNPTFEWVRLAKRIPVRIHIDDVPEGVRISAGMTCTVVVSAPAREWAIMSLVRDGFARQAPATEIQ